MAHHPSPITYHLIFTHKTKKPASKNNAGRKKNKGELHLRSVFFGYTFLSPIFSFLLLEPCALGLAPNNIHTHTPPGRLSLSDAGCPPEA